MKNKLKRSLNKNLNKKEEQRIMMLKLVKLIITIESI